MSLYSNAIQFYTIDNYCQRHGILDNATKRLNCKGGKILECQTRYAQYEK